LPEGTRMNDWAISSNKRFLAIVNEERKIRLWEFDWVYPNCY
jgi:hypothetical protein